MCSIPFTNIFKKSTEECRINESTEDMKCNMNSFFLFGMRNAIIYEA